MWIEPDMSLWRGRIDGPGDAGQRWHQCLRPLPGSAPLHGADVLLGFACDEGVRRNLGRTGAAAGPDALRSALAGLPRRGAAGLFDAGTVACEGPALEPAQAELATRVAGILERGGKPIVLGGGHEVAWGSYQGLRQHTGNRHARIGMINFDAHFDLRNPAGGPNSGTPFRQIAQWCEDQGAEFPYLVLGINPAANGEGLFRYARERQVRWFEDIDCVAARLPELNTALDDFIEPLDGLHLSLCLDAFPAAVAPGVSAPGIPGMCPRTGLALLQHIAAACVRLDTRLLLLEVAEMNPRFDPDGITARWGARLVDAVLTGARP